MSETVEINEEDALRMLAYLTASADTQLFEPNIYGPFRLVEAASQLAGSIVEGAPAERRAFWQSVRDELEEKKFLVVWDKPGFREFVNEMPAKVARELAQRDQERGGQ